MSYRIFCLVSLAFAFSAVAFPPVRHESPLPAASPTATPIARVDTRRAPAPLAPIPADERALYACPSPFNGRSYPFRESELAFLRDARFFPGPQSTWIAQSDPEALRSFQCRLYGTPQLFEPPFDPWPQTVATVVQFLWRNQALGSASFVARLGQQPPLTSREIDDRTQHLLRGWLATTVAAEQAQLEHELAALSHLRRRSVTLSPRTPAELVALLALSPRAYLEALARLPETQRTALLRELASGGVGNAELRWIALRLAERVHGEQAPLSAAEVRTRRDGRQRYRVSQVTDLCLQPGAPFFEARRRWSDAEEEAETIDRRWATVISPIHSFGRDGGLIARHLLSKSSLSTSELENFLLEVAQLSTPELARLVSGLQPNGPLLQELRQPDLTHAPFQLDASSLHTVRAVLERFLAARQATLDARLFATPPAEVSPQQSDQLYFVSLDARALAANGCPAAGQFAEAIASHRLSAAIARAGLHDSAPALHALWSATPEQIDADVVRRMRDPNPQAFGHFLQGLEIARRGLRGSGIHRETDPMFDRPVPILAGQISERYRRALEELRAAAQTAMQTNDWRRVRELVARFNGELSLGLAAALETANDRHATIAPEIASALREVLTHYREEFNLVVALQAPNRASAYLYTTGNGVPVVLLPPNAQGEFQTLALGVWRSRFDQAVAQFNVRLREYQERSRAITATGFFDRWHDTWLEGDRYAPDFRLHEPWRALMAPLQELTALGLSGAQLTELRERARAAANGDVKNFEAARRQFEVNSASIVATPLAFVSLPTLGTGALAGRLLLPPLAGAAIGAGASLVTQGAAIADAAINGTPRPAFSLDAVFDSTVAGAAVGGGLTALRLAPAAQAFTVRALGAWGASHGGVSAAYNFADGRPVSGSTDLAMAALPWALTRRGGAPDAPVSSPANPPSARPRALPEFIEEAEWEILPARPALAPGAPAPAAGSSHATPPRAAPEVILDAEFSVVPRVAPSGALAPVTPPAAVIPLPASPAGAGGVPAIATAAIAPLGAGPAFAPIRAAAVPMSYGRQAGPAHFAGSMELGHVVSPAALPSNIAGPRAAPLSGVHAGDFDLPAGFVDSLRTGARAAMTPELVRGADIDLTLRRAGATAIAPRLAALIPSALRANLASVSNYFLTESGYEGSNAVVRVGTLANGQPVAVREVHIPPNQSWDLMERLRRTPEEFADYQADALAQSVARVFRDARSAWAMSQIGGPAFHGLALTPTGIGIVTDIVPGTQAVGPSSNVNENTFSDLERVLQGSEHVRLGSQDYALHLGGPEFQYHVDSAGRLRPVDTSYGLTPLTGENRAAITAAVQQTALEIRIGFLGRLSPSQADAYLEFLRTRHPRIYERVREQMRGPGASPPTVQPPSESAASPIVTSLAPLASTETALQLDTARSFARTPFHQSTPDFNRRSQLAYDIFHGWWTGQSASGESFRSILLRMREAYGEIPDGNAALRPDADSRYRSWAVNDAHLRRLGVPVYEPPALVMNGPSFRDELSLPGVPDEFACHVRGGYFIYPEATEPLRAAYFSALQSHLNRFTQVTQLLDRLHSATPRNQAEIDRVERVAFDIIVDFGRVAAAFRPFVDGNWGLFGPMIQGMVHRLGYPLPHVGYLDYAFQQGDPARIYDWFYRQIKEAGPAGARFFPPDEADQFGGYRQGAAPHRRSEPAPQVAPPAPAPPSPRAQLTPHEQAVVNARAELAAAEPAQRTAKAALRAHHAESAARFAPGAAPLSAEAREAHSVRRRELLAAEAAARERATNARTALARARGTLDAERAAHLPELLAHLTARANGIDAASSTASRPNVVAVGRAIVEQANRQTAETARQAFPAPTNASDEAYQVVREAWEFLGGPTTTLGIAAGLRDGRPHFLVLATGERNAEFLAQLRRALPAQFEVISPPPLITYPGRENFLSEDLRNQSADSCIEPRLQYYLNTHPEFRLSGLSIARSDGVSLDHHEVAGAPGYLLPCRQCQGNAGRILFGPLSEGSR